MRNNRFTFLCTEDERHVLTAISKRLARTESDTVRCLIREAARELLSGHIDTAHPGGLHERTRPRIIRSLKQLE